MPVRTRTMSPDRTVTPCAASAPPQIVAADWIARFEYVHPEQSRHIEKDPARRQRLHMFDPKSLGSLVGDRCCGNVVVELSAPTRVAQTVPVRGGLQAHRDGIVTGAEHLRVAGHVLVDHDHRALRIGAARDETKLQSFGFQRPRQRESTAGSDGGGGLLNNLVGDEVQGSNPIVRAPSAPVVYASGGFKNRCRVRHHWRLVSPRDQLGPAVGRAVVIGD